MKHRQFEIGDPVVYSKEKCSGSPGRRAHALRPAPRGESYWYQVDKFWTVVDCIHDSHQLVLITRRGKRHVVGCDDPRLRPASLWERVRYRGRFPVVEARSH